MAEEENKRFIECGDDRFEIIKRAREHIIDATNIESRPEEMKVLDNFLFRCWQMGWLKNDFHQLEKENAELKKHIDKIKKYKICPRCTRSDVQKLEEGNAELKAQIEKMKNFIHSEIDFCMYCPLTNECVNDEGACPYAYATEEEQKNLLMDYINKIGS